MVLPKIEIGKDFQHFQRVNVSGANFPQFADVQFKFRRSNMSFSLVWEGEGVVEYSFNGNTVHGDMQDGTPTEAMFFDNRNVNGIWFRLASGSAGDVRVEGWAL
jgi:hypothetical protein